MRIIIQYSLAVLTLLVTSSAAHGQAPPPGSQTTAAQELRAGSFNQDWIIRPATSAFAVLVTGAGKAPQTVTLPHDAMLGLPRAPEHGSAAGYFPGGAFEYLNTLRVPEDFRGKRITFQFEGVYRDAMVFINGEFAGQRPHGYSNFYVPANAGSDAAYSHTWRSSRRSVRALTSGSPRTSLATREIAQWSRTSCKGRRPAFHTRAP